MPRIGLENINIISNSIYCRRINIDNMYEKIVHKKKLILEKYGIYNGQYEDAENIVNIVIGMLETNTSESTTFFNFSDIGEKLLKIKVQQINGKTNAGVNYDGNEVSLFVNVNKTVVICDKELLENDLMSEIETSIIHELNHIKNNNERNYFDTSDWYKACTKICDNYYPNTEIYHFAFCLYMSEYREIQAMCSEVPKYIMNEIKKCDNFQKLSNEEKKQKILGLLYDNEIYKAYSVILGRILPEIKSYIFIQENEIIEAFKCNGCNMTRSEYNQFVKQIEYGSKRAISKMKYYINYVFKEYNLI